MINCLNFSFQSFGSWLNIWKYLRNIDNLLSSWISLNFRIPDCFWTDRLTLCSFLSHFVSLSGSGRGLKYLIFFVTDMMCMYKNIWGCSLFCHHHRFKTFFFKKSGFLFSFEIPWYIFSYTMVVNFCQFPLTLSFYLGVHLFFLYI